MESYQNNVPPAPGSPAAVIREAEASSDSPQYECAVIETGSRHEGVRRFNRGVRISAPAIGDGCVVEIRSFGSPTVQGFRRRLEATLRSKDHELEDDDPLPEDMQMRLIRETTLRTVVSATVAARIDGKVVTSQVGGSGEDARHILRSIYFPEDEEAHDYKIIRIIQSLHDQVDAVPFGALADLPKDYVLSATEIADFND